MVTMRHKSNGSLAGVRYKITPFNVLCVVFTAYLPDMELVLKSCRMLRKILLQSHRPHF